MNAPEPMSFFDTVELPLVKGSEYRGELFRDLNYKTDAHTNFRMPRRISRHQTDGFMLQRISAEVKCIFTPDVSDLIWRLARVKLGVNGRRLADVPLLALRSGCDVVQTMRAFGGKGGDSEFIDDLMLGRDGTLPIDDSDDIGGAVTIEKGAAAHLPIENSTTWRPSGWPKDPSPWCLVKVSLHGMGRKP